MRMHHATAPTRVCNFLTAIEQCAHGVGPWHPPSILLKLDLAAVMGLALSLTPRALTMLIRPLASGFATRLCKSQQRTRAGIQVTPFLSSRPQLPLRVRLSEGHLSARSGTWPLPRSAVECARPGRAGRIAMIAVVCASSRVRAGNAPHMTKRHCAHIEVAHCVSFSLKLLVPSGSNRCQLPRT